MLKAHSAFGLFSPRLFPHTGIVPRRNVMQNGRPSESQWGGRLYRKAYYSLPMR